MMGVGISGGDEAHQSYLDARDPNEIRKYGEEVDDARVMAGVGIGLVSLAGVVLLYGIYELVSRPDEPGPAPAPAPGGGIRW